MWMRTRARKCETRAGRRGRLFCFLIWADRGRSCFFVVMESLKGDGAANDIARKCFKGLGIRGIEVEIIIDAKLLRRHERRILVIVYRSGLTKGTGVLSGARRIDVTMSITRIPL